MHDSRPGRRVAIVAGLRTPFAKSGTVFRDVSATALARHAARELLVRTELDGREVDEVIFGQVVPSVRVPNVAREVSLLPQLLPSIPAYSLNRACASAAQAITNAADQIALGHADVDLSRRRRVALRHPGAPLAPLQPDPGRGGQGEDHRPAAGRPGAHAAAGPGARHARPWPSPRPARRWASRPRRWPRRTASPARPRTASRCRATSAPPPPPPTAGWPPRSRPGSAGRGMDEIVAGDNGVRPDTSLEALAELRPVFDRRYGSVTAGNSSPLTDGAAAVLLMAEDKAAALGYEPLAFLRSYAVAAVDPGWQLLMGPVYAVPARSSVPASAGATSAWWRSTRPLRRRCSATCRHGGRGLGRPARARRAR